MKTYVVVGCGGIGFALAPPLARMLMGTDSTLYLVDGKSVRSANLARQFEARDVGENKAIALARRLSDTLGSGTRLTIVPIAAYVEQTEKEAHVWLNEEDPTVFLGVDTAASRVCIENILVEKCRSFTLISGGNAEYDGQAVLTRRLHGKFKTPLPSDVTPDIRVNDGRTPSLIPCDEAQVSEPQLVLANAQAALCMLGLWYGQVLNKPKRDREFNYVKFDMRLPEVFPASRQAVPRQAI